MCPLCSSSPAGGPSSIPPPYDEVTACDDIIVETPYPLEKVKQALQRLNLFGKGREGIPPGLVKWIRWVEAGAIGDRPFPKEGGLTVHSRRILYEMGFEESGNPLVDRNLICMEEAPVGTICRILWPGVPYNAGKTLQAMECKKVSVFYEVILGKMQDQQDRIDVLSRKYYIQGLRKWFLLYDFMPLPGWPNAPASDNVSMWWASVLERSLSSTGGHSVMLSYTETTRAPPVSGSVASLQLYQAYCREAPEGPRVSEMKFSKRMGELTGLGETACMGGRDTWLPELPWLILRYREAENAPNFLRVYCEEFSSP
jgi:hypothetical protein